MATASAADLVILYGSQTGNAEELARRVGYIFKQHGNYKILIEAMDDFRLADLARQKIIIFICSTTGHGQQPENMKNLFNFIRRRDLPEGCLSNLSYTVYGIGDSSYARFNWVAKVLNRRLEHCGANKLQEPVFADEQHPLGYDALIYEAIESLLPSLLGQLHPRPPSTTTRDFPDCCYDITFYDSESGCPPNPETQFKDKLFELYNLKKANCTLNERVTAPDHFQDTRHLCFLSDGLIDYEPGDVCAIFPANPDQSVREFIDVMNLDPDKRIRVIKKDPMFMVNYLFDFVPDGLTVFDLVKHYLDIQSVPKRSFFQFFSRFCQNTIERAKLEEFASTEGQGELYDYCSQPKRSILEVLIDFHEAAKNVDFAYILDMIPPIKPRSFSIACSCKKRPNEIHLLVGRVEYKTLLHKLRRGLCSNYLADLVPINSTSAGGESQTSGQVIFFLKQTSFKLPGASETPVVMVGPGLGLAPFRSFIEERATSCGDLSQMRLYFGCRYEEADFYFKAELQGYASELGLNLTVAFSREKEKQYVQQVLKSHAEIIKDLVMNKGACIYVAGNSKLPDTLRTTLSEILAGSAEPADEWHQMVNRMETTGRIQYDCW